MQVFVPGVLACSPHIEQGDVVAISVAVERPDGHGGWSVGLTRGTTLFSEHAKTRKLSPPYSLLVQTLVKRSIREGGV